MDYTIENKTPINLRRGRSEYTSLGVYDNIDIQAELYFNKNIPKTRLETFFYKKEISDEKEIGLISEISRSKKESKDKVTNTHLTSTKYNICLDDLKFSSKNHLEYNLTECFSIVKILGEGSFGLVVEALLKTDCIFAKELPKINEKYSRSKVALKIIPLTNKNLCENFKEEAT